MSVTEAVESTQQGPTVSRPTYRLIQILRAVAALLVVAHHTTIMLGERDHLPIGSWIAGSSGVDLFFVISGFVMTISSAPLRTARHPARTFLARRLERIVPLYWLVTAAKVVVLLLVPALAVHELGSGRDILSSFLFFPYLNVHRLFEPVVLVGWSLNFEMAFYLLFAAALALRKRPELLTTPVLILVPLAYFWLRWIPSAWLTQFPPPLWFYINTLLWEFLFGMLLGALVTRVRRLPWLIGAVLVVAGLWALMNVPLTGKLYWRGLIWGPPALAVVAGAIAMERRWGHHSPRWALELGDASYSIYLIHTFTLPAIGIWLLHWPHHWQGELEVAMTIAIVLSALSGEIVYRLIELPIMRWFKGRRKTAVPANA